MDKLQSKSTEEIAKQKEIEQQIDETRTILKQMMKDGKLPEARSLTRSERRKMDKDGININAFSVDTKMGYGEMRDKMCDFILDTVYPEFNFDQLPNNVCFIFAMYTYGLTYEDKLAIKN